MLRALALATLAFALPIPAAAQTPGVLRITVVLADADGKATPAARYALLVSDNPPTAEPRRIMTGLDGTVEVKLRPGNYTIESDRPLAFRGRRYQWLQTVDVAAGRDTVLAFTAANAETGEAGPADATPGATADAAPDSDPAFLLHQWQGGVVAIWTAATHASGFLVDAKGLVVTSQRGIGAATTAEVQFSSTVKVAARVLAADAERDVAVLWIDPKVVADIKPLPLACTAPKNPGVGDKLFAIGMPLRGDIDMSYGTVSAPKPREIGVDFVLPSGSIGGPVFDAAGAVVGLTSYVAAPAGEETRQRDVRVVRSENACAVIAGTEPAMKSGTPPGDALLPVEPTRRFPEDALTGAIERRHGSLNPYVMSSADFDLAFITPLVVYAEQHESFANRHTTSKETRDPKADLSFMRPRMDYGVWADYVVDVRPVLLVRITPRFVEGFWTKVGRIAAETQGMALPAFKRFKSGFVRMRARCGANEVVPIHPFELERPISEKASIDEGLYVFDPGAFGPQCGTVTFELYSAAAPDKADTAVVDPKILDQIWQDFAPFRDQKN